MNQIDLPSIWRRGEKLQGKKLRYTIRDYRWILLTTSSLQKINVKETFLCVAKSLLKINCPEQYKEDSEQKKKRIYCF